MAEVPNDGTVRLVGPGQVHYGEEQLEAACQAAERTGAHVWIAAAAFRVSEDLVRRVMAGDRDAIPHLDGENVASISLGCYRCEEPLTTRLLARTCRGEPTGG